jgi:rubredoxin-NAD+ reductase
MNPILIIGTGLAGYTVAREFRKLDTTTPLQIVTRDDGSFYSKPVLSNALAQKKAPEQIALASAADMARQLHATINPHAQVTAIDPAAHVVIADGEALPYSRLVLAVGADPIPPPLAGNAADDVLSVNNLADYARFRAALNGHRQVAILGAGLIGCEFANDLRSVGVEVDVIDLSPQPLGRLLPTQAAGFFRGALEQAGVRFHLGTSVEEVARTDAGMRVRLATGTEFDTEIMLSAIGLRPQVTLARTAGIEINRGIVTDTFLQTSAPDIYALGDCAEVAGHNLPFVMPIMQAGRALAKTLSGTVTGVHYPVMPVLVKTPACPTVIAPPPRDLAGSWEEAVTSDGVRALFQDTEGRLRGFALLGVATKDKQALAKDIPPLLG